MSIAEELEKLASLLERGHITREEYDAQKAVLLGGASSTSPPAMPTPPPIDPDALLSGGTRMAAPTDPGPTIPPAAAAGAGDSLSVGATLADRYIITRKLGEGGMGTVYLAVDKDTEQTLALKTISARLAAQPGMLDSLKKEVAMARKLGAHPCLLRILDIHLRESPPFITMEAAMGGDLYEYWLSQSRKLRPDDATRILKQVLSGLEALHNARVVHQDIKPQNILMAADGSVKITDYGISKSIKEQVSSGGVDGSGTLAYMAPEQLKGEICDRRADIYAVGIMAHQLVTGKFPFTGTTEAEVEAWHTTGPRNLARLQAPFDELIPRMIAINPDERFSSAQAVLDAISSPMDLEDMPTESAKPPPAPAPEPTPAPAPVAPVTAAQTGSVKIVDVGTFVVLYFVTCSLYQMYLVGTAWPAALNRFRGDSKYNAAVVWMLMIFTCFIAALAYPFAMFSDLEAQARKLGLSPDTKVKTNYTIGMAVGFIINLVGGGIGVFVWIWALWVVQKEINRIAEAHNQQQAR